MDGEKDDYGSAGGGECADCLKDMKEAWDAGDFDTAAIAFKQAVHAAQEGGGEPDEDDGKGILAILGKPKK